MPLVYCWVLYSHQSFQFCVYVPSSSNNLVHPVFLSCTLLSPENHHLPTLPLLAGYPRAPFYPVHSDAVIFSTKTTVQTTALNFPLVYSTLSFNASGLNPMPPTFSRVNPMLLIRTPPSHDDLVTYISWAYSNVQVFTPECPVPFLFPNVPSVT